MIALGALFIPLFIAGVMVYLFAEVASFIMRIVEAITDER
jgi:hypothetical protein